MSINTDIDYYRRRTLQESERAHAAGQGAIRNLHLELASLYADRVREAEREMAFQVRIAPPI